MANETLICEQHISSETLSTWRDDLLSPAEMERIRTHAAQCAACQARLDAYNAVAQALRSQREIEPDGRLLAGLRARAAHPSRRVLLHLPNRRVWQGLGALGSVAAILLIAVYLLGAGPGRTTGTLAGKTPLASTSATQAPTATPSPTTTPTYSPVVSASVAWGSNAASAEFTATIDATHIFEADGVTTDGQRVLGIELTISGGNIIQSAPAQAGILDIATHRFTPIRVADRLPYPPGCCDTDGRFLIAYDSAAPGATCGICNTQIWSYDLTTGTLWKVAVGGTYGGLVGSNLSHGILLLSTQGDGIQVVNLAAHTITPMRIAPSPTGQEVVSAFDWPYVVYGTYPGGSSTQLRLHDLETGQDMPLPQVDALYSAANQSNGSILITGDTLFASVAVTDAATGKLDFTTLYEMDSIQSAGARPHAIGAYHGDLGQWVGANNRLVVFWNVAWDRGERRFVTFTASPNATPVALTGDELITTTTNPAQQPLSATPPTVTIYDTATLPSLTG